jgi:hypothetical protein
MMLLNPNNGTTNTNHLASISRASRKHLAYKYKHLATHLKAYPLGSIVLINPHNRIASHVVSALSCEHSITRAIPYR